jgi:glycosyltransferase involved in cell wall biosynthesis
MKKAQHVAIFLPSLSGGGAERIALVLADEFVKAGIRVDMVLAHHRGEYLRQVPTGVNVVDLNASRMIFAAPKLARYLHTQKPDVLLSTIELANIVACIANLLTHHDHLWVMRQANYPDAKREGNFLKKKILHFLLILAFRSTNHIIAVSRAVAENIIDLSKVPQNQVSCIYNPTFYNDLNIKRKEAIEEDWLSGSYKVIISAGRLSQVKDFPTLIKAFAIAHRINPDTRLVIFGEGNERPQIEHIINQLHMESYVMLPGFVDNPFPYLSRASVFVLSSTSEGFPNVLVEAMACGCPVISTDCPGGPREILNDGAYGHLVPVGDAEAMACAILDTINGNVKPVPADWLEQFKPAHIASQYLQVFDQLMQARSDRS